MKAVGKLLGTLFTIFLIVVAVEIIASESGEVVVVTTTDEHGTPGETRLWVLDHDGSVWLRAGSERSSWYQRMHRNPRVTVSRGGDTFHADVVAVPELRDTINGLMNEKYGWADDYISLLFGRSTALPLRLDVVTN